MRIKLTSCEPMIGDAPDTVYIKNREELKKAADSLQGKMVPILNKEKQPSGRFVTNIIQEGPYLWGEADLSSNEYISMNYTADEKDVVATMQSNLRIANIYLTDSPRFAAQKADSVIPNQGVSNTSQSNTPITERPSASALAPPTPPVQPAPAAPAPAPQPEQEPADVRELKDMATREWLKSQLAGLNITDAARRKIEALPLKKQYEQISFLKDAVPPAPVPQPAPAPLAAHAEAPVAVPPNANALAQPAPREVQGVPFEEMRVDPGNGQPPRIIKRFDPTYIVGRDRINAPKRGRPTA